MSAGDGKLGDIALFGLGGASCSRPRTHRQHLPQRAGGLGAGPADGRHLPHHHSAGQKIVQAGAATTAKAAGCRQAADGVAVGGCPHQQGVGIQMQPICMPARREGDLRLPRPGKQPLHPI